MWEEMRREKISFIENELDVLVKKIDRNVRALVPVDNSDKTDINEVIVIYGNDYCNKRINIECDSLLGITKDVIKRI